jgi:hypothetical protein
MLFSPAWAVGKNFNTVSVPEFIVWREQKRVFQEIAPMIIRAVPST